MVVKEATIVPEAGLHARPASLFVKTAKQFSSSVTVVKDGCEANAKSPMKLMTLGAKKGDGILIQAEGEDEEQAVDALVKLISKEEE